MMKSLFLVEGNERARSSYLCVKELQKIEGVKIEDTLNHYGEGPISVIIDTPEQNIIDKIRELTWVKSVKEYRPLMFKITRD